jgi:hypothetical protein
MGKKPAIDKQLPAISYRWLLLDCANIMLYLMKREIVLPVEEYASRQRTELVFGWIAAFLLVSEPGLYEIDLFGTKYSMNWEIYCGSIFVVPETAIGSLIALLVGFGAIADFKVVKTKKIILP